MVFCHVLGVLLCRGGRAEEAFWSRRWCETHGPGYGEALLGKFPNSSSVEPSTLRPSRPPDPCSKERPSRGHRYRGLPTAARHRKRYADRCRHTGPPATTNLDELRVRQGP